MKRKWLFTGISLGLALVIFVGIKVAFAAGVFGRPYYSGYLTGQHATGVGWVFVPLTPNEPYDGLGTKQIGDCLNDNCTVTLQSFLAAYRDRLFDHAGGKNAGNAFIDRGRAAASIDVMLGQPGPSFCTQPPVGNPCIGTVQNGINYAVKNFNRWVNLVTLYTKGIPGYSVQWNFKQDFTRFNRNAMGLNDAKSQVNEDCSHGQQCTGDITFIDNLNDAGIEQAVVFRAPGGFVFYIKHKCANLTGDTRGLPVPPTWNLSATSAPTMIVHPGDLVTFTHTIHNSPSSDKATFDYTVRYKFFPSAVYKSRATVNNVTLAQGGGKQVKDPNPALQIPVSGPGAQDGVQYCEYISFTNATGPLTASGSSLPACVTVKVLATPTCGSAQTSKDSIDPLTVFNVKTTVDYPSGGAVAAKAAGDKLYVQVSGPTYNHGPISAAPTVSGNSLTHTFTNIGPTNQTGTFTINYGVKNSSGVVLLPCSQTFVIADEPYFSVNEGDVETGAAMTVNDVCAGSGPMGPDNQAGVVSWNRENAAYDGAGTQYAAMALGYLQDFATAQGSGLSPSGLSFANTVDVSSPFGSGEDTFGGGFDSEPCVPDYTVGLSGALSGIQVAPSPSPTGHTTFYVNGDVFINSDVSIYNGAYGSLGAIPTYEIVVSGGNIYIAPGVTRLDGLYVAEPDSSGKGGNIYTCTTVPTAGLKGSDSNLSLNLSAYYGTCNRKLTVNGSFVAKQVYLLRTRGTLYDSAAGPAETFNFNPELWLAAPNTSGVGSAVGADDSITSLPPIL